MAIFARAEQGESASDCLHVLHQARRGAQSITPVLWRSSFATWVQLFNTVQDVKWHWDGVVELILHGMISVERQRLLQSGGNLGLCVPLVSGRPLLKRWQ